MRYLLLIFLMCQFFTVSAKKINYPSEVVAGMSDHIVYGEITEVKNSSYIFKISETLKGREKEEIKVEMFKEGKCDRRWKKAEAGQKLILFLIKKIDKYEIINGSTEELFVINDRVRNVMDEKEEVSLEIFKTTIRNFCLCYKFKGRKYDPFKNGKFRQFKSDAEILALMSNNRFSQLILDDMKNYVVEKHKVLR